MLKRANFRLTVLCGILIALNLCIQETQGIKCYVCTGCAEPKNEVQCKDGETLCSLAEKKDGTKLRDCARPSEKDTDDKNGVNCNTFVKASDAEFKRCYCDKDLCNGSGTAKGRYHIFIPIFLYATVYQGKVIN